MAAVVRYRTKPDRAEENRGADREGVRRARREPPEGLRYASFRLADGVSFVHVARGRHRRRQQPADPDRRRSRSSCATSAIAAKKARSRPTRRSSVRTGSAERGGTAHGCDRWHRARPWVLTTPSGGSEYTAYRDESRRSAGTRRAGRQDPTALPPALPRRPARDARRARRLGAARQRRRAEARGRRHRRGLGACRRQPGGRLVRPEEGSARPVRQLRSAGDGKARPRRSRTQRAQQPHARHDG